MAQKTGRRRMAGSARSSRCSSARRVQAVPRPPLRRMEGRTGTDAGSQNLWPGGRRASARHLAGVAGVSYRAGRLAADQSHGGRTEALPLMPCASDDRVPAACRKITAQVLSGKPQIEGIGCASCHLIKSVETTMGPPPTFKIEPGKTMHGPYADRRRTSCIRLCSRRSSGAPTMRLLSISTRSRT